MVKDSWWGTEAEEKKPFAESELSNYVTVDISPVQCCNPGCPVLRFNKLFLLNWNQCSYGLCGDSKNPNTYLCLKAEGPEQGLSVLVVSLEYYIPAKSLSDNIPVFLSGR